MAANDLIILSRAYQILQGVSGVDALLQSLITAASDAIAKPCRTAYDELYSGNGDRKLLLRQYPLVSVQSVRYHGVTVLKITNTDPTNVQARAAVTATGLTLVRVKNGVKTTDTSILGHSGRPRPENPRNPLLVHPPPRPAADPRQPPLPEAARDLCTQSPATTTCLSSRPCFGSRRVGY
jgi:hypothetical protein